MHWFEKLKHYQPCKQYRLFLLFQHLTKRYLLQITNCFMGNQLAIMFLSISLIYSCLSKALFEKEKCNKNLNFARIIIYWRLLD